MKSLHSCEGCFVQYEVYQDLILIRSIPGLVRTESHELVVGLVVDQPLLPGAEGVPETGSSPAPVVLWVVMSNFTVMMDNTTTLQSAVSCCSTVDNLGGLF